MAAVGTNPCHTPLSVCYPRKKLNGNLHMRRARNGLYPLLKMSVPQGKIAIQRKKPSVQYDRLTERER